MLKNQLKEERTDKETLEELYVKQLLPMSDLCHRLHIPLSRIRRDLNYYGFTRSKTNAQILAFKLGRKFNQDISGPSNPQWKGGRRKLSQTGYIRLLNPNHHRADSDGYVYEHIAIWEATHGKELPAGWIVHHLNGVQFDNRPENLIAMSRKEHVQQTIPYKKRIRELELEIERLQAQFREKQ